MLNDRSAFSLPRVPVDSPRSVDFAIHPSAFTMQHSLQIIHHSAFTIQPSPQWYATQ
jgi:hypothetical protein